MVGSTANASMEIRNPRGNATLAGAERGNGGYLAKLPHGCHRSIEHRTLTRGRSRTG